MFISFALELRPLNDFESPNPQGKKDEKMEKVAPTILQVRNSNSISISIHQYPKSIQPVISTTHYNLVVDKLKAKTYE